MTSAFRAASLALLLALPAFGLAAPKMLDDFNRTVTETPFEIVVDQRACGPVGVYVQVLGAGGPGLDDAQASSGYLVWVDGRARILVDAGPGTALRFEESGASFDDLLAVVITHMHADHTADLPALLQGSRFEGRKTSLPIYGPTGNDSTPGFNAWIDLMIGARGAYPDLSDFLSPLSSAGYEVLAYEVEAGGRSRASVLRREGISLSAIPTDHGAVPTLAWRVDVEGVGITFTGDTANRRQTVAELAKGSALLVADHSVPENVRGFARELHMPPSQIGKLARDANVNQLILSHRTSRTRGRETQSRDLIREEFKGPVVFANDMECWET
ncbi:MAG TPA: MBL fold metallo-hydrolase [Pseudomonadales bacterium]|nr:MBL fold metallo-hydrolase [Pseudomonadales bacterium]